MRRKLIRTIFGRHQPAVLWSVLALVFAVARGSAFADTPLTTVRVVSGLDKPIWVTHAPGDTNRLFVLEQPGRVRIVKNGALLFTPFLDLSASGAIKCCNEQGLLGLAFHPDYAANGQFFVNYTRTSDGATVVARYGVSNDPDIANAQEDVLFTVGQPFVNHNGGWIAFGPDGYLYIALGDGGDRDDPGDRAQDVTDQFLGKLLRLDVDGDDFPNNPARNYAIPPDNPFVGVEGDDEIWAYGLRNPWRNSFDPVTGDLYIADVGQDNWEEINIQRGSSKGGENYGWRCREGLHCNPAFDCTCDQDSFLDPLHEYTHGGVPFRCSVTGGEVYRGCAIPDLSGTYFFADYCSHQIWSLRFDGTQVFDVLDRTEELAPGNGLTLRRISSFGRDARGELYACDREGGEVFKIVPATPIPVSIAASDPPNEAIDARQPVEPDGVTPAGWDSIELTFVGANPPCVETSSFLVTLEGSAGPVPSVAEIEILASNRLRVTLDRPIPIGAWTRIRHVDTVTGVRIGFLPGDVNGSRETTSVDLIELIDALNGVGIERSTGSTDIDRSGNADAADVARMIELLGGSESFPPYLGMTLP